jgi:glycosyltransferase involved in cell wall biosynthesis
MKMDKPFRLCLIHAMDPRGAKFGGIETHVRQVLSARPDDFSLLFVGIDECGDAPPGRVMRLEDAAGGYDFFPVAHIPADRVNLAAKSIGGSTTLAFVLGLMRNLPALKRALNGAGWSADIQRHELVIPPKLLGGRVLMMVHNEGSREQAMDSLLKRYWFLHEFNESVALRLADHVLGVNANIVRRIAARSPAFAAKAGVMSVPIDTRRYQPTPFKREDGVFRICFAGRLDAFKDPPLMFRMLSRLREKLNGALEFHYVGATDPHRYAEFAAIESFTRRHGLQMADKVAHIMSYCHAGVLTSHFEGMPCYLLEMLASGRPVGAIRLPQYDPLIVAGVSGGLVERTDPDETCLAALVEVFANIRDGVFSGALDPARIAALTQPFALDHQMARHYGIHRALQSGKTPGPEM